MIEVEIKVAVKDRTILQQEIVKRGFEKDGFVKETDIYFDSPHREKDTALRVRTCENLWNNTAEHFMTFKGPKLDEISMTRKELEMRIESAATGIALLSALGYVPVSPVIKNREVYGNGQMTICLDQVEDLGEFMELEMIVSQESERENALEQLFSLLEELGYEKNQVLRTSYLSMLQKNGGL